MCPLPVKNIPNNYSFVVSELFSGKLTSPVKRWMNRNVAHCCFVWMESIQRSRSVVWPCSNSDFVSHLSCFLIAAVRQLFFITITYTNSPSTHYFIDCFYWENEEIFTDGPKVCRRCSRANIKHQSSPAWHSNGYVATRIKAARGHPIRVVWEHGWLSG